MEQPPRHQLALPPQELTSPVRPTEVILEDLRKLLAEQMQEQSERWGVPLEKL